MRLQFHSVNEALVTSWLNFAKQARSYDRDRANASTTNKLQLELHGKKLSIGNVCIDLSRKPMMSSLFRRFFATQSLSLSRHELIETLYGIKEHTETSPRLLHSRAHSAVRLVSRTRAYLNKRTQNLNLKPQIDWLHYCPKTQKWKLFELF